MDRKTLLAMTLCFLIYAGWQKFYLEPLYPTTSNAPSTQVKEQATEKTLQVEAPLGREAGSIVLKQKTSLPVQTFHLETLTGPATLSDTGSFFLDWSLKQYRSSLQANASAVDLGSVTHQPGELTLAFDDRHFAYLSQVHGAWTQTAQGARWTYEDKNVRMVRDYKVDPKDPAVQLKVDLDFHVMPPQFAFVSVSGQSPEKDPEAQDRHLFYWTKQKIERVPLKDSITQYGIPTPVKYIGLSNRYFIFSVIAGPQMVQDAETSVMPTDVQGLVQPAGDMAGRVSLVYPIQGSRMTIPVRVYFGPKELSALNQVEPALNHTIDFGWFTVFAYPLLNVLKILYQFVKNYGIAIILLTLLLKVLTYPLTLKSMKSMKKMAKLQPQIQRLKDRYKDDREALNREMLTLMKGQGYNPMAGCLPMLIQMPIFFALYRVLYSSIELYHAPFALWIRDLSSQDPFYVTPVLLSLAMFFQQKVTPTTTTDPAQAKMMQWMPLIFGAFMLALPAGLTLYMLANALAGIAQQLILNKKLDA